MGVIIGIIIIVLITKCLISSQREKLIKEILSELHIANISSLLKEYDDTVIVKSRQTLNNYSDIKYIREKETFERIKSVSEKRKQINSTLYSFLRENKYKNRLNYAYVRNILDNYLKLADGYRILITYITPAGNNKGQRIIHISAARIDELEAHPEYLMTKGEYNKLLKQRAKVELEEKKHLLYDRVNSIIDYANESKEKLIVKSQEKVLDDLIQKLFDRTVNSIQKISKMDSDEWEMIESCITNIHEQVINVIQMDNKIKDYYNSDEFMKIKTTCNLLTQSQREFNDYINEKAQTISTLFGKRVIRNETKNEDVQNYVRTYKKSITPFTAEVSAAVFGSAENNPISYILKYFYPNKSQYKDQIQKLKILIEELETLKEAKVIIDNYKKDYAQYIMDVPEYVVRNDEAGFYSRLGLAVIDESVLNVEYKFIYTSNGGMAQRYFTVPMNEENIIELINQLEGKLSVESLAKEQRALMTTKLRKYIKERDNYTCCKCGNSIYSEPNLLLEIDHIIPVSKGGLTREDNLQTLCWKCNRNKGAKIGW